MNMLFSQGFSDGAQSGPVPEGLSEARFAEIYGTEEQCHAALVKWRVPNGFECPGCNGADHCVVTRGARRLFQCNACRKQTSVKAGTIFASSKLPLRIWFKTIYLVTQSKKGISSIELGRRLGVTQTAAWMRSTSSLKSCWSVTRANA